MKKSFKIKIFPPSRSCSQERGIIMYVVTLYGHVATYPYNHFQFYGHGLRLTNSYFPIKYFSVLDRVKLKNRIVVVYDIYL